MLLYKLQFCFITFSTILLYDKERKKKYVLASLCPISNFVYCVDDLCSMEFSELYIYSGELKLKLYCDLHMQ